MRTIIAGSRNLKDRSVIVDAIAKSGFTITTVISGMAIGPDSWGKDWGNAHQIPVIKMPALWNLHGKSAGYLRNLAMAERADALIAIWDGISRGTQHMINIAKSKGLKIYIHKVQA